MAIRPETISEEKDIKNEADNCLCLPIQSVFLLLKQIEAAPRYNLSLTMLSVR